MKSLCLLFTLLLTTCCMAFGQGQQDPNMRQIRRDLSTKTSSSSHHYSAPAPSHASVATSANSDLTKLEQGTAKIATEKPKHISSAAASLPKDDSEKRTRSGLRAIPPRPKQQMATNKSGGKSRVGGSHARYR